MPRRPEPGSGPRAGLSRNEVLSLLVLVLLAVAVVLPYFQYRARAAKRSASLQNLRQWGIALNLYLVESDNSLPASGTGPDDARAWFNTLPVYLSLKPLSGQTRESVLEVGLWTDPAARVDAPGGPETAVTYGMNAWLHPHPDKAPCRIYEVEDPTATFFLLATEPGRLRVLPGQIAYRHGVATPKSKSRSQALFCDGHVEEISPQQGNHPDAAKSGTTPPARPTWVPYFNAPAPH